MKVIIILLILLSLSISSANASENLARQQQQQEEFFKLVEGMKNSKYISAFPKNSLPCVYGKTANKLAKKSIIQFFSLLRKEFITFYKPIFVTSLGECPPNTIFYIFLHESNINMADLLKQVINVNKRNKIKLPPPELNKMGFFLYSVDHYNAVGFASINQLSNEQIKSKSVALYLRGLIVEELFQMVTASKDLEKQTRIMSIAQESIYNTGSTVHANISTFLPFLKNNSKGLCGYDIWFLINLSKYNNNFIDYRDFKIRFLAYYKEIIKRSEEIETDSGYEDLFDPRCSGNNTGVNTKIGMTN